MLTGFCTDTLKREAARELLNVINRDRSKRQLKQLNNDIDKKASLILALQDQIKANLESNARQAETIKDHGTRIDELTTKLQDKTKQHEVVVLENQTLQK